MKNESEKNESTVIEEFHENGRLKVRKTIIYDKYYEKNVIGLYQEYFENGQLKILKHCNEFNPFEHEGSIKDEFGNLIIGFPYEEFYENGQLKIKTRGDNSREYGDASEYHPAPIIREEYKFSGPYEEYYENGQLKIKTIDFDLNEPIKNKLWAGYYEEYYENGQLKIETVFIEKSGLNFINEYYQNGKIKLKSVFDYRDGGKHFIYESYYQNGQLEFRRDY